MIKYILVIAIFLIACTPLKVETVYDVTSPPEADIEKIKEEVVEPDPDDSVWILKGPVTAPRGCIEWRKRDAKADC